MPDFNMLGPAAIVFFISSFMSISITKASGRKTAQRQQEAWAQSGGAPEHAWIDDSASFGATLAGILCWIIGSYIIVSLLFDNPLWVMTLFH